MKLFRRSKLEVILNPEEDCFGGLYASLRKALNEKPKELVAIILGGKFEAADCLVLWDALNSRDRATKLIVEVKSNLYDAALLLVLSADDIRIRPGVFWESHGIPSEEDAEEGFFEFADFRTRLQRRKGMEPPWANDLKLALREIGQYLPLKELKGRVPLEKMLKEFGLMHTKNEEQSFQNLFKPLKSVS